MLKCSAIYLLQLVGVQMSRKWIQEKTIILQPSIKLGHYFQSNP